MEINKLSISTCSHPISKHNHHSPLENTSPSKASAQPDVDSVAPRRCARYIDDDERARTLASAACTVTDTRLEKGKTRHGQWRTPLNATALIYIYVCIYLKFLASRKVSKFCLLAHQLNFFFYVNCNRKNVVLLIFHLNRYKII